MKNGKGFTLVELLAVIVVLAIVLIIAVPGVLSIINKAKNSAYDRQIDMIKEAARLYVTEKGETLNWQNETVYVLESQLKENGNLESKIIDPRNKKELTDFAIKVVRVSTKKTTYDVILDYSDQGATSASCFTFDQANHEITGYDVNCPKDLHIPSKINGVEVYSIKTKTFSTKKLKTLILPKTLKQINEYAFYANHLTQITIPKSVTYIGYAAFNLNQLPDDQAFIYKRTSDGNEDKSYVVSYGGSNQNVVIPNQVTTIGHNSFQYCNIQSVVMPEGVKTILPAAFHSNVLTSLNIPSSVTSIGAYAFNDNQLVAEDAFIFARNNDGTEDQSILIGYGGAASSLTIPSTVTRIKTNAFSDIGHLTQVIIPNTVQTLENKLFTASKNVQVIVQGKTSINSFLDTSDDPWGEPTVTVTYQP